jgi:hypothetical protein
MTDRRLPSATLRVGNPVGPVTVDGTLYLPEA